MRKTPRTSEQFSSSSKPHPISGRISPLDPSIQKKLTSSKTPAKKTRFITPRPLSPTASLHSKDSRPQNLGKGLVPSRLKSPHKLVTLGNEPIQAMSKFMGMINSPRSNELKYADKISQGSGHMVDKPQTNKLIQGISGLAAEKANDNLKKMRE